MSKKNKDVKIITELPNKKPSLIEPTPPSNPKVDLRYLHYSNKCLKNVGWNLRKNKPDFDLFFDGFQKFILDFSSSNSISEAVKLHSSHVNGSKNSFAKTDKVKSLLKLLPEDVRELANLEVTHLHFKKNGNGRATAIGFFDGGTFNVLGLYDTHD